MGKRAAAEVQNAEKRVTWLISTSRKQTLTALHLSFVEGPSNNEKDKKKSFSLICQTPSKVYFFITLGLLLVAYYVAQISRAIGRKYTAITGYLLIKVSFLLKKILFILEYLNYYGSSLPRRCPYGVVVPSDRPTIS